MILLKYDHRHGMRMILSNYYQNVILSYVGRRLLISNGNRTEWRTIQGVIGYIAQG